jgi:hypothetical protein
LFLLGSEPCFCTPPFFVWDLAPASLCEGQYLTLLLNQKFVLPLTCLVNRIAFPYSSFGIGIPRFWL